MNKNIAGAKIKSDKDIIIAMYNDNILTSAIADKYNVKVSTICMHLKKWGIKLKKGAYNRHTPQRIKYKMEISPKLLAQRKINSQVNDKKIKYIKFVNTTEDQRLIDSIIQHPIIG